MTNDIFKQLNNLPKHKLSARADFKLRLAIRKKLITDQIQMPADFMVMKHFAPVAAAVVALFLIVAIPTYSYASSGVTYGHILYPVKETIEKVELALAGEEEKVEKIEKFTARRLNEAEVLSQDYKEDNEALIATINKAVELKTESHKIRKDTTESTETATPPAS